MNTQQEIINNIYIKLKERKINPRGYFDKQGRFWLRNRDLVDVRRPSPAWPYSQMTAARTKKYVQKVCEKYNCDSEESLRQCV